MCGDPKDERNEISPQGHVMTGLAYTSENTREKAKARRVAVLETVKSVALGIQLLLGVPGSVGTLLRRISLPQG